MKYVLALLLLVNKVPKGNAGWLSTPNGTKTHATLGLYAELHENETLHLACEQSDNPIEFIVPDGLDFTNRRTEYIKTHTHNFDSSFLNITNMTEADTGKYTCKSYESDSIYVFVHKTSIFMPAKSIFINFDEDELIVPCKTTKIVSNGTVQLYVNGDRIASHAYDQRYGFVVSRSIFSADGSNLVECRYTETNEVINFISTTSEVFQSQNHVKQSSLKFLKKKENTSAFMFAVLDISGKDYTAKWTRAHISSIYGDQETHVDAELKTITLDSNHSIELLNLGSDLMKTNISGTYTLTITLPDGTVEENHWELNIENDKPVIHLTVRDPAAFTVFNQNFYRNDTEYQIDCTSVSIPSANLVLEKRIDKSDGFEKIEESQLSMAKGTFEERVSYKFTPPKDTEFRCISTRENTSSTITIHVADGIPQTRYEIEMEGPTTRDKIYEGDKIRLFCDVPTGAHNWNVSWLSSSSIPMEATSVVDGNTRSIVVALRNVTTKNYTCLMKAGKFQQSLQISILVNPVVKPYYTDFGLSSKIIVFKNDPLKIDCNITGTPIPVYKWNKNGILHDGERILQIVESGAKENGTFTCTATNNAGFLSRDIQVHVAEPPNPLLPFKILVGLLLIAIVVIGAVLGGKVLCLSKAVEKKHMELVNLYNLFMKRKEGPLPEEMEHLPIEERTDYIEYNSEISIDRLNLLEVFGRGKFGLVRKGIFKTDSGARIPVAVKSSLKIGDLEAEEMMADELKVMSAIPKHPNVLALIGGVTKTGSQILIVTEYMNGGDLLTYLRKHQKTFIDELNESGSDSQNCKEDTKLFGEDPMCTADLKSFMLQIARGMEWLASIPCVHRDLACRNVLVAKNKTIRIADFGLARKHLNKTYYRADINKKLYLPMRWCPLEACNDLMFTEKSDVWAFGVCLYEIFTLGGTPYPNFHESEIAHFIKSGNRNPRPKYCSDEIYELMKMCWETAPEDRPTFKKCVGMLLEFLYD